MAPEHKDRLAVGAVVALTVISLAAIVGGVYAATVSGRETEGIIAVVSGAVAGIVALVLRDTTTKGGNSA